MKEEILNEFDEAFGYTESNSEDWNDIDNETSIGQIAGCDDCPENCAIRNKHRNFVSKLIDTVHNNALRMAEDSLPEEEEEREFSSEGTGAILLMQKSYKMTCRALREQREKFISNMRKLRI